MKRLLSMLTLVGAIAAAPACATVYEVQIVDNMYVPSTLTVAVGDSIHWTNDGAVPHTVDSGTPCTGDGDFDSGTLSPGDDFGYLVGADEEGLTISYFCDFHCFMGMVASYTVEVGTPAETATWGKIRATYR